MFYFTHGKDSVNSSAVKGVWFNKHDGELVVHMNSGDGYQYSKATEYDFKELTEGRSPGTHFATRVKRDLGPGRRIRRLKPAEYFRPATVAAAQTPVTTTAVGTPKGLVTTSATRVTLGGGGTLTATNGTIGAAQARAHKVVFTLDGNKTSEFNVKAKSVDEAVGELNKAAQALGYTAVVKEVTVKFE